MDNIDWRRVVFCFFATIALGMLAPTPPAAAKSPERIEVLLSADDALCKPMAAVFTRLNRKHPHSMDPLLSFPKAFSQIGITQPPHLEDPKHKYTSAMYGSLNAFYKIDVAGEGKERLVYLEDLGTLPDVTTLVWIFKNNADYRTVPVDTKADRWYLDVIDNEAIDFLIDFITVARPSIATNELKKYTQSKGDYYFEKLYSDADRAISEKSRYEKDHYFLSAGPQRIFLFEGKYYFLSGYSLLNVGLVYRLLPALKMDDICYFATDSMIKYAREDSRKAKGHAQ